MRPFHFRHTRTAITSLNRSMKEIHPSHLVHFALRDHILIATYLNTASPITLEKAKLIWSARLDFQRGVAYPVLIKTEKWITIQYKALSYFASPEAAVGLLAAGLLKQNIMAEMAINFFLQFKTQTIPTKAFSNEATALGWLARYTTAALAA